MSPEEVNILIPDAAEPSSQPGWLQDGANELLRVEHFDLLNEFFTASLYFKERKLSQVTLTLTGEKSFDSALRTFDSVSAALCSKYGQEVSRRVSNSPFPSAQATWLCGRININVTVLSVATGHLVFNINYQATLAREADKM
jgi:hypothetical protein